MHLPRSLTTFVLTAAALLVTGPAVRADEPLNLLFFGNSFTIGSNVPDAVGKIAVADGHSQPLLVVDTAGGTDLDRHISQINNHPQSNVESSHIAGKTYDYAVIQGYSTEATHLQNPATDFIPDAVTISNLLRSKPSGQGTNIVLFETWARHANHSFYTGTPPSFTNPAAMQTEIRTNYQLAKQAINDSAGRIVSTIAPVGDAFENGNFALSLYAGDYYHASAMGSRLASLVIYRTIYHEKVGDIPYSMVSSWVGLNTEQWQQVTFLADTVEVNPIPEPASLLLLIPGLAFLFRRVC